LLVVVLLDMTGCHVEEMPEGSCELTLPVATLSEDSAGLRQLQLGGGRLFSVLALALYSSELKIPLWGHGHLLEYYLFYIVFKRV
jgi:hypothetical protein